MEGGRRGRQWEGGGGRRDGEGKAGGGRKGGGGEGEGKREGKAGEGEKTMTYSMYTPRTNLAHILDHGTLITTLSRRVRGRSGKGRKP